jgi:carnitine O-acetyltransferase
MKTWMITFHHQTIKHIFNYFTQLSEWWLDSAYLSYRLPVLVHSNPALVFPKQSFSSQNEQLTYAAKLIIGALRYKAIIDG